MRKYHVIPDTLDFRDRIFQPTLIDVPQEIGLKDYMEKGVPVLDQKQEGACTGFGLATVCHYLLRTRKVKPDKTRVSAHMLYEMAKRYDEWPGEKYEGSSARGAVKGWHKHGVCAHALWKYDSLKPDLRLNNERAEDAARRPLGAYYRVNHKDIVSMHTALAEVGVLYATAIVHAGWDNVGPDGIIRFEKKPLGGHAYAIVAYDETGFWIQNSWGEGWGSQGFGHISYDDWLENGMDVWVARLGVPVKMYTDKEATTGQSFAAKQVSGYTHKDLRPHIISLGNNGQLRPGGMYGTTGEDISIIFEEDIPRITERWQKKRILLYTHGGFVSESSAIEQAADYRNRFIDKQVYPLVFSWNTDLSTTLRNMLQDAMGRILAGGVMDDIREFMLDRTDDSLEWVIRKTGIGKAVWGELKQNAISASTGIDGGIRPVLRKLDRFIGEYPSTEVHIAGHSAGCILHAPLVQMLSTRGLITEGPLKGEQGYGRRVTTCTLWAPACSIDLFKQTYLPVIKSGEIVKFALFALKDRMERDDNCEGIYNKSALYLISNACEEPRSRIPMIREDGEPLLGMEKFLRKDTAINKLFESRHVSLVLAPNEEPSGSPDASGARRHTDFDNDDRTLQATLARILS